MARRLVLLCISGDVATVLGGRAPRRSSLFLWGCGRRAPLGKYQEPETDSEREWAATPKVIHAQGGSSRGYASRAYQVWRRSLRSDLAVHSLPDWSLAEHWWRSSDLLWRSHPDRHCFGFYPKRRFDSEHLNQVPKRMTWPLKLLHLTLSSNHGIGPFFQGLPSFFTEAAPLLWRAVSERSGGSMQPLELHRP